MPDQQLPPALTPEEWAAVREGKADFYDRLVRWDADDLPSILAAANHDLPEGSLYKITWADVEVLCKTAGGNWDRFPPAESDDLSARLDALVAKLAALLPPATVSVVDAPSEPGYVTKHMRDG